MKGDRQYLVLRTFVLPLVFGCMRLSIVKVDFVTVRFTENGATKDGMAPKSYHPGHEAQWRSPVREGADSPRRLGRAQGIEGRERGREGTCTQHQQRLE